MRKNGFTIVEVVVVFLLILGVTFLTLPKSLESTKQAKFISKWTDEYSQLQYIFSVIHTQNENEFKKSFSNSNKNEAKKTILKTIKPYLRITSELQSPNYKQYYMNKSLVKHGRQYYFDKLYLTDSAQIVGLKWIKTRCINEDGCILMSLDINGISPPNVWGYDIFGIYLLKNKIEPLGKGIDSINLKNNCSKYGTGVYCSYYYLIGGAFDN